jgi:hypothetical protein
MESVKRELGPHIFKSPQALSQPYHTIYYFDVDVGVGVAQEKALILTIGSPNLRR